MAKAWWLIALLLLGSCSGAPAPPEKPGAKIVMQDVVEVPSDALQEFVFQPTTTVRLADSLTLPGRIQYSLDGFARIATPLVGIIKSLPVHLGAKVEAGQVLASIESADIGMAYSDFAKAESDLILTRRSLELSKDLYAVKSLSKKEFDQAQNDYNKAQAEFNRARQRLLTLRVSPAELGKPGPERHISTRFDLKSPLTGVIVEKSVTLGQVVGQDQTQSLFTVADLEILQVVAEVYERDLRFLKAGMVATVSVESFPNQTFPAKLVHVGEMVDPATRTIKIRCDVTNIAYKLKPEMFARVQVVLSSAPTAVTVPRTAVVRMGLESVVFVRRSETSFERRPVVTGTVQDGSIEIREGLKDGEQIVAKGAVLLKGAMEKALEQVHIQSL
jgi:cobalt-zinc-cadmium efflux system membrane fusion protein